MGLGGRPRTQANETTFETSQTGRPLPAAWTSSCGSHGASTHSLVTGPRGLTALPGAEPAVTIAGWQICPVQVSRASGHTTSLAVAHGPRAPSAERRLGASTETQTEVSGEARIICSGALVRSCLTRTRVRGAQPYVAGRVVPVSRRVVGSTAPRASPPRWPAGRGSWAKSRRG